MLNGEVMMVQGKEVEVTDFAESVPVTKYIPLASRLIGKLIKDPNKEMVTKTGIIMPNDMQEPYVECQIIKVGRGTLTNNGVTPNECQIGDIALLFNGKNYFLKDGAEKFIIFNESDIVATYRPTKKVVPEVAPEVVEENNK